MVLSCVIILIHLISLKEWKNHQDNGTVIINTPGKKEILVSLAVSLATFLLYGTILYFIGSKYPFFNAAPTIAYLLGNYYYLKRSSLGFVSTIIYETLFMTLWVLAAVNGEFGSAIFLIDGITEFVYGFIGLHEWKRLKSAQSTNKTI